MFPSASPRLSLPPCSTVPLPHCRHAPPPNCHLSRQHTCVEKTSDHLPPTRGRASSPETSDQPGRVRMRDGLHLAKGTGRKKLTKSAVQVEEGRGESSHTPAGARSSSCRAAASTSSCVPFATAYIFLHTRTTSERRCRTPKRAACSPRAAGACPPSRRWPAGSRAAAAADAGSAPSGSAPPSLARPR